jgi:nickel/cobalt transporter (NicO) family protein
MAANRVRLFACGAWILIHSLLATGGVSAHPLGNFTINHLAEIRAAAGRLRVHYVLDFAEIPTFQIMHTAGAWTAQSRRDWQNEEAARVAAGLSIESNGVPLQLQAERTGSRTRPGAGGLPTLYWTGDFAAALRPGVTVTVRDEVYAQRRIGWKDIVLPGLSEPTNELRSYPNALIGSPRHNDVATFSVLQSGRIANARVGGEDAADWSAVSIVRSSALADLFSRRTQTPLLILLTALAAFGLGGLHALEPGHGKALLAFTLVGARASMKQAAILAGALTFAHTIAVILLGLLLLSATQFASEQVFSWIALASGAAVTVIGGRSLFAAVARVARERHHVDGHAHAHALPGTAPLHFPSAVVAAMSGGIAPCPAAIVVLLTALRLRRIGYGLVLIVIFSFGLAAVLTALGFAVVHGAAWLQRRSGFARLAALAPFLTALVISTIGAIMLAQASIALGAGVPSLALVALTLLAIAVFAAIPLVFSLRATHHTTLIKEIP